MLDMLVAVVYKANLIYTIIHLAIEGTVERS